MWVRARGTDFVRLRPASASVRFLRNLPVRRPNPSLKRTNEVRPPSASVRLGKMFERPRSESVLEADGEGTSVVRIRPLETVRIGQASVFVRSRPHLSAFEEFIP